MTNSKKNEKLNEWGRKHLGYKAEPKDIVKFLSECVAADSEIIENQQKVAIFSDTYIERIERVESPLDPIEEGKNAKSWKQLLLIDCNDDEDKDIDERDFTLYYAGADGKAISVELEADFIHVFYMPEFGNDYRISVFETKDKCLHLGYFDVNSNENRQLIESSNIEINYEK